MSAFGAPQQHKQASRKGKKAWRKNVDVTGVQDGLEVYQEEVRSGGPLRDKNADELFALDTVGSKEIVKKYNLGKPLKVDEILAKRSSVPAVDTRKRGGLELGDGVYEPASKRRKGDWVTKEEVQRLKKSINTVSHIGDDLSGDQSGSFDLWNAQPVATVADDLDYIPKAKPKVAPATLKMQPNAITANGKSIRSVPNPKAGSSYNPDYDEWNEAIIREGDREVEVEKLRLKAEQEELARQARVEAAAAEDERAYRTEDESAWEGFETENEDAETLKQKRPARKTPAERNKIKRRKEAERIAKHEKKMADKKKFGEELARMMVSGGLVPVDREDTVAIVRDEVDDDSESGDDTRLRRRKLGTAMVPEKRLEIVLPEELQDSLRRLKPEGNLLQDRFRNLLVNGKLESRKPVQAKKRKVKMTEKWTYKDFSVPV